jgi:hypothetical protein
VHSYVRDWEKPLAGSVQKRQAGAVEARTASFAARTAVGFRGGRGLRGLCTVARPLSEWVQDICDSSIYMAYDFDATVDYLKTTPYLAAIKLAPPFVKYAKKVNKPFAMGLRIGKSTSTDCVASNGSGMNAALKMAATESAFAGVPVHFAVWQADDYPDSEKPSS